MTVPIVVVNTSPVSCQYGSSAARSSSWRCRCSGSNPTVHALRRVPHMKHTLVQVDVRPAQTQQLAAPHAKADPDRDRDVQTVPSGRPEEGPRLLGRCTSLDP